MLLAAGIIQICHLYNTSDKELGKSVLPLKNLQREDDALGPSELVSLFVRITCTILSLISVINTRDSTDWRGELLKTTLVTMADNSIFSAKIDVVS